jgi:crotonobetainyl-CoA:carnitine CoA-transferase CaiB-like acyl-CoA transferase
VFITNYPPPVRRRLAITYEELAPLNERLIYASFTGYGEVGPEADKPGFDATAWWARSGLMHLVRAGEEASPARSLPGMGDHPSAMATYGAIVTALYQRERTGKGACVGSSLLANGLWANGCAVQAALCGEKVVPQPPRERGINALRIHYRCRDNRWILLSLAADEWRWDKFKDCMGSDALDHPRFATVALREANAAVLIPILDKIFATRNQTEWRRILDDAGLIFGIVADMDEIADDEQILASEALVPFADGTMTVNSPLWIQGQQKVAARRAPAVGEHSKDVLREAGYSDAEVRALRTEGVIG